MWPDHAAAVAAFLAAATQWRTTLAPGEAGIRARFVGLDYAGANVAWAALGITMTAADWPRLQTIEAAARDAQNEETV